MNQIEISPEINQRILDSLDEGIMKLSSPSNKYNKRQVSFGENLNIGSIINTSPQNIINSSISNSNNINNLNNLNDAIDDQILTGNDNSPSKVHSTTTNRKTTLNETKNKKGPFNYEFEYNSLKEKYEKTKKELVEVTRKISEQEKILQKTKNKRKGIDKKYKENCVKTKEMEMKVDYLYEKLKQSEIIRTEQQKLIVSLRLEYTELKKFFPNYKGIDDKLNITDDKDCSNSDDSNSFEIKFDPKIIDTETGDENQTYLNNNSNLDFSKGDILNIKNEGLTSIVEDEGEDSVSKLKNDLEASKKNSKGSKTNSMINVNNGDNIGNNSSNVINNNDNSKVINKSSSNNVNNTNVKANNSKPGSKKGSVKGGSVKGGSVHGSSKSRSVKGSNKK